MPRLGTVSLCSERRSLRLPPALLLLGAPLDTAPSSKHETVAAHLWAIDRKAGGRRRHETNDRWRVCGRSVAPASGAVPHHRLRVPLDSENAPLDIERWRRPEANVKSKQCVLAGQA